MKHIINIFLFSLFSFSYSQDSFKEQESIDINREMICDDGYTEINEICFYEDDIAVLQKLIDNSYASNIDLGCEEWDSYCGSPNPYMDSLESWFWVTVDGESYGWTGDENGRVDPLELGIQEWHTEITTFRLEYNYLSGFIPPVICDLGTNHLDYLAFDVTGNLLCPPYPECIDTQNFWYQDTSSCSEIGDINNDAIINVQDIIILVSFILNSNIDDYQQLVVSDINGDGVVNIVDVVVLVDSILG